MATESMITKMETFHLILKNLSQVSTLYHFIMILGTYVKYLTKNFKFLQENIYLPQNFCTENPLSKMFLIEIYLSTDFKNLPQTKC